MCVCVFYTLKNLISMDIPNKIHVSEDLKITSTNQICDFIFLYHDYFP